MPTTSMGKTRPAISSAGVRRLTAEATLEKEWCFGLDGDDIGHTVESALMANDIEASQNFERQIKGAFAEIEELVADINGAVLFNDGDNILFTAFGNANEIAEKARDIYKRHTGHTSTCGVGSEPAEAHKSLIIGKNTGKDRTVVWSSVQDPLYEEIKARSTVEAGDAQEDIDLSSPALKHRAEQAQKHYGRLRGIGYNHSQALHFVNNLYKLADSYRDTLLRRKKPLMGDNPAAKYLRDGEERYKSFMGNGFKQESAEDSVEIAAVPTVGQKIVTPDDFGRIAHVGSRFVSVEWLQSGRRERIAFSRYRELVSAEKIATLPQVRLAKRNSVAVRN